MTIKWSHSDIKPFDPLYSLYLNAALFFSYYILGLSFQLRTELNSLGRGHDVVH